MMVKLGHQSLQISATTAAEAVDTTVAKVFLAGTGGAPKCKEEGKSLL